MFTLEISLTSQALDAIKIEMNHRLPAVKSSHRCEAIARGLGCGTYAAARTASRLPGTVSAFVNGRAFTAYLAEHGFNVEPTHLYSVVARIAIADIAERYPRLTDMGIGAGQPWRTDGGKYETPSEHFTRLQEGRKRLMGEGSVEPFLLCLALLARVTRTKTVRPKTNSYWIKHIAENYAATYPEGGALGPCYVPNGVLIAAAIHAGFDIRTHVDDLGYDSLNTSFNMSNANLVNLDCEIRPNGARAQDRRRKEDRRAFRARFP